MTLPNSEFLLSAFIFALLGIVVLVIAFIALDKIIPEDLWGQIVREKNLALAVLVGSMMLGISIIIAAAIH